MIVLLLRQKEASESPTVIQYIITATDTLNIYIKPTPRALASHK